MDKQCSFFAIGILLLMSTLCANGQSDQFEVYDAVKLAGMLPQPEEQEKPEGALPFDFTRIPAQGGDCLIPVDETHLPVTLEGLFVGNGCDDCSSSELDLQFDYDICGSTYSSLFINSNGNITFEQDYDTYTPVGIPNDNTAVMIAPFWADVDLRDCDNGTAQGTLTYKSEPNRFIVTWTDVGYFDFNCELRNTFQVVLTDGTDPEVGLGFNTAFYFGDMNWTTGDVSGGVNGFGGSPATVGINANDGVTYSIVGRFDHEGDDYDGPEDEPDGVDYLDFQCFAFAAGDCAITFCDLNGVTAEAQNCEDDSFDLLVNFNNGSPGADGYVIEVGDYTSEILPYDTLSFVNEYLIEGLSGDGQDFEVIVTDIAESDDCFASFEYVAESSAFAYADLCVGEEAQQLIPDTEGGTFTGDAVTGEGLFEPTEAGEYEITYTVPGVGCTNASTETIVVSDLTDASFEAPALCAGGEAAALVPATEGGVWLGDNVDLAGNFDPSELEPGDYEVTYSIAESSCPSTSTQTVSVGSATSVSVDSGAVCVEEPGSEFFSIGILVEGEGDIELTGDFDAVTAEAGNVIDLQLFGGPGAPETYIVTATTLAGGCSATVEVESISCPICSPDAGQMVGGDEFACDGDSVSASGEPVSADGLVWEYVLHDNPGASLGEVQAANNTGVFLYDDTESGKYNVDYYISTVVGPDSGDGTPSYEGSCVSVAEGAHAVFLAPVEIELNGSCDWQITGDFTLTVGVFGGLPEYDQSYTYNVTGFFADSDFQYGQTFTIVIPATDGTQLSFAATDNGLSCNGTADMTVVCFKTPVSLLSFVGENTRDGNLLSWSTATEFQNDYFVLEHAIDGESFIDLARIEGSGTTETVNYYQYLHDSSIGVHYYRLAQVDEDGTRTPASDVVQLVGESFGKDEITISPNPSSGLINIGMPSNLEQSGTISIYSTTAQLLLQIPCRKIVNAELDLSSLKAGVYFIQFENEQETFVKKFMKR